MIDVLASSVASYLELCRHNSGLCLNGILKTSLLKQSLTLPEFNQRRRAPTDPRFLPFFDSEFNDELSTALFLECHHVFLHLTAGTDFDLVSRISSVPTSEFPVTFVILCDDFSLWTTFSSRLPNGSNVQVCPTKFREATRLWVTAPLYGVILSDDDFAQPDRIQPALLKALRLIARRRRHLVVPESLFQYAERITCLLELFSANRVDPARFAFSLASPGPWGIGDYDALEQDTEKFAAYDDAIRQALVKLPDAVVGIIFAGRGRLVDCAIQAGAKTVVVSEDNPGAALILRKRFESDWSGRADVRIVFELSQRVDILVWDLLGSFGDDLMAPERVSVYAKYLSEVAISIPAKTRSFIVPVSCEWLFAQAADKQGFVLGASAEGALFLSEPQNCFRFAFPHPGSGKVAATLRFCCTQTGVVDGIIGWFKSELFGDVKLSSAMVSGITRDVGWRQVYLPFPKRAVWRKGEMMEVRIAREVAGKTMWYEWSALSDRFVIPIQNFAGEHCKVAI